jgi:hypothetical protein
MNAWHYDVNAKSKMSFNIFAVVILKTSTNGKVRWTYDNCYSTFGYHLEFVGATKKSLPKFVN